MKFNTENNETSQEYKKRIRNNALDNLRTDEDGHDVRQEVSKLLLNDDIKGRPHPISRGKSNPTRVRCNRQIQYNTYPRKLKSDKQKFFYLKDLFVKREIHADIFIDLAEVLKEIKPGTIKRIVKAQGQSAIGSTNIPII